jgi:phage repressor protein C with HTH and peptisase S24 domain
MTEYQGEKFKSFLSKRGINVNTAAEMLDVSRQAVYLYFKTTSLKRETVNKILDAFKVSESEIWGTSNPRLEAIPLHISADPHDHENDGSRFEELPDGTLRMRIPVVPHRAFAGYMRGFRDPEYYEDLEYISIDVFKQHRAHYLAFEVRGDSMTTLEPEFFRRSIFDGVKVVGRELARHQWAYKLHTHNYDAWVIVHKTEGILIKQITNHDVEKGVITIHSLNPDKNQYPDQDLYLDDVEQIFNVVKKIDE